jgi:hypothetical protein
MQPTLEDALAAIVDLTERALSRPFGSVEARELVEARAPFVEAALAAHRAGAKVGPRERALTTRIRELDERARSGLAEMAAEAREWLAMRESQRAIGAAPMA